VKESELCKKGRGEKEIEWERKICAPLIYIHSHAFVVKRDD
jgi:hypothetical protein